MYLTRPLGHKQMARVGEDGRITVFLHWWARPHVFVIVFLAPIFLICASLPDELFLSWKHAQNFMTSGAILVGLAGLAGFSLATWAAANFHTGGHKSCGAAAGRLIGAGRYRALMYLVLIVCLAAYTMLLGPAILDTSLLMTFATETVAATEMREMLGRVPGITSFVNLGPLYVTLLCLQPTLTGTPLSRFDKIMCGVFLFFVTARVFLWSERLALIETAIPFVIIRLAPRRRHGALTAMFPVFGIVVLTLFFGLTEYFRSWSQFYSTTGLTLSQFVVSRLFGYYATALNNGAVIFTTFDPPMVPYTTAEWFFRFPGFSEDYEFVWPQNIALSSFTNPEFTNTSGLFDPMNDLGAVAGLGIWLVLGLVTGRIYQGFTERRLLPMLLYPTWMTGVYEMLRIFYWSSPRYFPVLVFVFVAYGVLASGAVDRPVYFRRRAALRARP